jgi:uncharacterized protein with WD repeat
MYFNDTERFEKKACDSLFWSPTGQFIVLAGLHNHGGTLEFVDTNEFTIMNSTEHFSCSDVEWDPTGRYVVTAVSYWKTKVSQLNHEQQELCPSYRVGRHEINKGVRSTCTT